MTRPIVTLTTHLAEHASEFFAHHPNIDPEPHIRSRSSDEYYGDWGLLAFLAYANRQEEPDGYILRYKKGDCEVSLPAGRAVAFDYQAGFFTLLSSSLPLDPLPFDEMMHLGQNIADSFDKAGWKRVKYYPNITQEEFGSRSLGGKFEFLGEWVPCNEAPFYVLITLKNFNSLPTAPMIPPVPGRALPDDYPDRYIIEVSFSSKGSAILDEGVALRDARRLAVNGDKDKELTLKDWIDDPNWRPPGWQGKYIK